MYIVRQSLPLLGRYNKRIVSLPLSSLRPSIHDDSDIEITRIKKDNTQSTTTATPTPLTPDEYRKLHQVTTIMISNNTNTNTNTIDIISWENK